MVRLEKFKIAQVPTVAYQPKGMLKPLRFMIGPTAWELRPFQSYVVGQHQPHTHSSSVTGQLDIWGI